ncbi:hypothetical protein RU07_01975 [Agrobacterium tumefaciens]|uniref:Methyl-accepting chemotaxis protein n=1 Tax=Agrobacterium tumefaciens TaxID=358 RepID=A0A0D0L705_AGRTU|nr:hypothetical protein RU07_01975 [Agrobacterium tumefaciens]
MDQVTQQNAAMVEETNAAAATLAQETTRLRGLIEGFKLGGVAGRHNSVDTRHPGDKTTNRRFETANPGHRPVPSPAKQMPSKIAGRVGGGAAAESWEEF